MDDLIFSRLLPLLLGRHFMKTTRKNIDVYARKLTIEFDGIVIGFNIFEAMRYPIDNPFCFSMDVIDTLAQRFLGLRNGDELETTITTVVAYENNGVSYDTKKCKKLQLSELDKIQNEAYESKNIYKKKTKVFHDRMIRVKTFVVGQKILLFQSRLRLVPCKLRSTWIGPFIITNVFPHGVIQVKSFRTDKWFKVNGHQLKPYYESFVEHDLENVALHVPAYSED